MIYAVSAHLLPTYKLQHNFIKSKVSAICSSCNIRPTDKTNIDRFLDLKLDKRLIEMEQDYERTFKAHRQTKNGIWPKLFALKNSNGTNFVASKNSTGTNFVAPRMV